MKSVIQVLRWHTYLVKMAGHAHWCASLFYSFLALTIHSWRQAVAVTSEVALAFLLVPAKLWWALLVTLCDNYAALKVKISILLYRYQASNCFKIGYQHILISDNNHNWSNPFDHDVPIPEISPGCSRNEMVLPNCCNVASTKVWQWQHRQVVRSSIRELS